MQKLPPKAREIIQLTYLEGNSNQEVAYLFIVAIVNPFRYINSRRFKWVFCLNNLEKFWESFENGWEMILNQSD
ncbi:hypothetical protein [Sphingobacterium sp. ML3W]|uniref:hypothetical protein n=1 Tax=Sphingobacterium sp. ML3W TaxID=1538644 RepID=UPI00384EF1C9